MRFAAFLALTTLLAANSSAMQSPEDNKLIEVLNGVTKAMTENEPARAKAGSDLFSHADYLKLEENERTARTYLRQCLLGSTGTGRGEFLSKVRQVVEGKEAANCDAKDLEMVVRQWARMIVAKLELRGGAAPADSLSIYFDKKQPVYIDKLPSGGKTEEIKRLLVAEQEARRKLAAFFQFYEDNPAKLAKLVDDGHGEFVMNPKTSEEVIDSTHRAVAAWRGALNALRPLIGKGAK